LKTIALDIGNSADKLALLVGTPPRVKVVKEFDSIPDKIPPIPDGFEVIYISSVVPEKTEIWKNLFLEQAKVEQIKVLTKDFIKKVPMNGPQPQSVGPDRVLSILGALVRHLPPLVVIDCGSALTFNIVDEKGVFIGGFIAPGMKKMLSTASSLAMIPEFDFEQLKFQDVFGGPTQQAVSAGIYNCIRGGVKIGLDEIDQMFENAPEIMFTGGQGKLIHDWIGRGQYHPYLVLEGIAIAAT
jgi:type III pantothenate kinase